MKVYWLAGSIFFVVGLGMLTGGFFAWRNHEEFRAHALKTEGVVIDFVRHVSDDSKRGKSVTYAPLVKFTDQNEHVIQFSSSVSSGSPGYSRGDRVAVLYDPTTPEKAQIDSFMENWFVTLILGGMGVIFTLLGATLLTSQIKKRRVQRWLSENGMRVQARFEGVRQDTTISVNDRYPWCLHCQWQHPVTGQIYLFKSDSIWFDPTHYINREYLDVIVNADDPKQYTVDISFLPEKA